MTAGPGRFGQPDLPERPPPAGLFTRGYDRAGTDELVADLTGRLHQLTTRLYTVERENRRLRAERTAQDHAARVAEVEDSISILASAQENADQTIAQADAYREGVTEEVERLRAEARQQAEAILADARARSREVMERIDAEAADREQQARHQQEALRRQTDYLRSVRDAAGAQTSSFLNGLVDRVAAEFGAADPAAVPSGGAAPARSAPTRTEIGRAPVGPPAAGAPGAVLGSRTAGRRRRREPRAHVRHLAGR